jgi:hypothetical protein
MDNYPMGAAQDPSAPWNQSEPEEVEVEVAVSYSLSRSYTISTNDYNPEVEDDYDEDEDDVFHRTVVVPDFTDTNFNQAFLDSDKLGIPQLLSELQDLVKEKLESLKNYPELTAGDKQHKKFLIKKYKNILECATGWNEDDLDVEAE